MSSFCAHGKSLDDACDECHAATAPEEYAVVEVFGHRRHVDRVFEVERFGTKMLRIDVPIDGDFEKGYTTHFYGGGSMFSFTPCDLATVKKANTTYRPPAIPYHDDEGDDDGDEA